MIEEQSIKEPSSIVGAKRTFNRFVSNPVMEDYALRYAPKSFRKWSEFTVVGAALGGIAYMADFAIGGSITLSYGFSNAVAAILVVAAIIFLTGVPIAYYSAKYNIDMDLLTRGAGFGYLGSTLTSVIYASFTFIFFSLEGSVMAQAINLYFGIALPIGYLITALGIIPLVLFGMTFLAQLQRKSQILWLVLMVTPFVAVLSKDPHAWTLWTQFAGSSKSGSHFSPLLFASAAGVTLSLIAQIGEQADYLRFMPNITVKTKTKWWLAVLIAGPGWVILGALKQLGGSFLASYIAPVVGMTAADQPIKMFDSAYGTLFVTGGAALLVATLYVLVSQIKINVTNAYSGSLSWSNFFSRLFHFHPGRVLWLVFNVAIALSLMEGNVFSFINYILGFYSNIAVAWIGAVVADLVVNKPLKLSPSFIEFKRAHLYNFNPVGFGAMIFGSVISVLAFFNFFGATLQAWSPFLALTLAFITSPIIAYITKGKYYIAREPLAEEIADSERDEVIETTPCTVCSFEFEPHDMAYCPFHLGSICSLCCSLDKECHDSCKKGMIDISKKTPAATGEAL